jgi:flagellar biosynthesis anti-sigma factor FlgM
MKIDPQIQPTNEAQSDRVKNASTAAAKAPAESKGSGSSAVSSGDTFQLSHAHSEVQHLAAQAAQVSDVRPERVAPLRAQVQGGNYKPDSSKVADAVITEQLQKAPKA